MGFPMSPQLLQNHLSLRLLVPRLLQHLHLYLSKLRLSGL
jgi:hypothetical protein